MAKLRLVDEIGTKLTVAEIDKLSGKEKVTSLEMVDLINAFRLAEGRTSKLVHKNLLAVIRDEFEEEIDELKFQPISYLDSMNRSKVMFELTPKQAMQVLVRESKFVRKAVVDYLYRLEETNRLLTIRLKEKTNWKQDMEMISNYVCINSDEKYRSVNSVVNKVVTKAFNITKTLKKATMNEEQLEMRKSESRDVAVLSKYHGIGGLEIYKKANNIK